MIILDTNVLSEMMKPAPNPQVVEWLNAQSIESIYTTTITIAELHAGISVLPEGKRKTDLQERLLQTEQIFGSRILSFEYNSSLVFGHIMGKAKNAGRAIGFADGLIAAIASDMNFAVASRDTSPFETVVHTINPWTKPE